MTKQWQGRDTDGNTSPIPTEDLKKLLEQGVLPTYLRFALYLQIGEGGTWTEATAEQFPAAYVKTQDLLTNSTDQHNKTAQV